MDVLRQPVVKVGEAVPDQASESHVRRTAPLTSFLPQVGHACRDVRGRGGLRHRGGCVRKCDRGRRELWRSTNPVYGRHEEQSAALFAVGSWISAGSRSDVSNGSRHIAAQVGWHLDSRRRVHDLQRPVQHARNSRRWMQAGAVHADGNPVGERLTIADLTAARQFELGFRLGALTPSFDPPLHVGSSVAQNVQALTKRETGGELPDRPECPIMKVRPAVPRRPAAWSRN